jgi:hypothetical protein
MGLLSPTGSVRAGASKRKKKIAPGRKKKKPKRLKPISLHPLDFDTAIGAFLSIPSAPKRRRRKPKS